MLYWRKNERWDKEKISWNIWAMLIGGTKDLEIEN